MFKLRCLIKNNASIDQISTDQIYFNFFCRNSPGFIDEDSVKDFQSLGQIFFISCFTGIFFSDLGSGDEKKKIKKNLKMTS